jgi:rhodanese-related sulfurtransferase
MAVIFMTTMRKLLLTMTIVLGTVAALAADKFPSISTADLKKAISEKRVTLLDVNGTESWEKHHIPGALNFEAVEKDLTAKLPTDKEALIVAYCGNEQCPAYRAGAEAAKKLGYKNVKHYAKGIQGWLKAGEPTQKGS